MRSHSPGVGDLSGSQARRIALAAQGFIDRRPAGEPTRTHLKRVVDRTRLLQMDSVNILARAHYLPAFSRLGSYDPDLLDRAAWRPTARRPRLLVEYWAHEAALIPVDDWPLFGWRMDEYRDGRYRHTREILQRNRSQANDVLAVIAESGPMMPRDIEEVLGVVRSKSERGSWWTRGEVKHLCEALFASGTLSAVRSEHFHRFYDLAERVVGPERLSVTVDRRDAHRELVARAAAAHGIATVADLADYYRLKAAEVREVVTDLVDVGVVQPVTVEGWDETGYLHRDARVPKTVDASALLSPFDPLVFFRPRTQRLFGFHYRIEIYVPAHKRIHGYYVLPYLMGEDLVARVDLKADRAAGVLRVLSAHVEPGVDRVEVARSLTADLAKLAHWRGLSAVDVIDKGELGPHLRAAATQ
ncbi:winged helix-turn-helix domain-containing protein [Gordonia sp. (in: high G+C Gram-positive bacteria)]|uniref:winged helix-turn-helix domain-containing protein n=1 Tax=Gordonia sp. (in: high G+C Gram-positive bacteria) TaxID=84139 RepID=UPI003C7287F6